MFRYVYLEIFKKLGWSTVASLTMDGNRYSEYISHLQDVLQTHGINFIMNRKVPEETPNMSLVIQLIPFQFANRETAHLPAFRST